MFRIISLFSFIILFLPVSILGSPLTWMIGPGNKTVREMDYLGLSVAARDPDGHELTYTWSIPSATDGTAGVAKFRLREGAVAEVAFPWISSSQAGALDGHTVAVQVVVTHTDTTIPDTLEGTFLITIRGVNHPPVAVIDGNTGTPTLRIPTGKAVCINCSKSTEPDGDVFRANWALGSKTGGKWLTPYGDMAPVLMASEGRESCFTVIPMTAPIDQKVKLLLQDGLHEVPAEITAYLTPSSTTPPPTTTNVAPTMIFPVSPVAAATNSTAVLTAEVEDLNGDALDFSVVFLQSSTTILSPVTVALSATKTRVQVSVPTGPNAGVFTYRFKAQERNTAERKSVTKDLTLNVTSSSTSGPQPGDPNGTTSNCTGNSPPTVTFSPNPWPNKPAFTAGSPVSIIATGFDSSTKEAGGVVGGGGVTTQTGVRFTWDLSELVLAGGSATPVNVVRSNQQYTDSTLSFTAPNVSSARDVSLTVTAKDVYDCSRSFQFTIRLEPQQQSGNQPPTAKIQYRVGSGVYTNAPASPVALEATSAVTVTLKGDASTDDGGTSNLTYSWAKQDSSITAGGVSMMNVTGAMTTLQIAAHTKGTFSVTLTAKDQGNLTNTATLSFNIIDPALKPIARATAKVGGQALTGAVEEGTVVTLDGSASSRQDNSKTGLTYEWTQIEGPEVTIADADEAVATITAPAGSEAAPRLKFRLIVSDAGTPSDPAEVTVNLASPSFYFSQVAVGTLGNSEFRTVLLLVNRNEEPANGVEVRFFGSDGDPMEVTINGVPWDNSPFNISALGSKQLVFSGHDLKSGWARVNSSVKIVGLLQYQIVGEDQNLQTEVGLYATEAATKFATFYDLAAETAIAVANTSSLPATVRIRLIDQATGNEVITKNLFVLEPGQVLPAMHHKAKFLNSDFLGELPPDFSLGTLLVESNVPVSVTVLKTRGGVVFSTLPVASMR